METKQHDGLIKNAVAALALISSAPPAKAVGSAPEYLSGRRDVKAACLTGPENSRLFFRLLVALEKPIDTFDTPTLLKLHQFLFEDIRAGAGKLRTLEANLNGSSFTGSSLIAGSLKRLLSKMNEIGGAPELSKEDFAITLTHYFREIFLLCPFGAESPLAEAVLLYRFAAAHGYRLDYFVCGGERLSAALVSAFLTDETSDLFVCLNEAVSYISVETAAEEEIITVEATPIKRRRRSEGKPKIVKPQKEKPKPRVKEREDKPKRPDAAKAETGAQDKKSDSVKPRHAADKPKLRPKSVKGAKPSEKAARMSRPKKPRDAVKPEKNKPTGAVQSDGETAAAKENTRLSAHEAATVKTENNKPVGAAQSDGETAATKENTRLSAHEAAAVRTEEIKDTPIVTAEESAKDAARQEVAAEVETENTARTHDDFKDEIAAAEERRPIEDIPPISSPLKHLPKAEPKPSGERPDELQAQLAAENDPEISIDISINGGETVVPLAELSASTLRKAAKIKEKIESLQKQLRSLLSHDDKKDE